MLSQYTWWDFIKFVLLLAVPYYLYVLWVYYREDVRDWLSNRGGDRSVPAESEDDEDLSGTFFTVKDYSVEQKVEADDSLATPRVRKDMQDESRMDGSAPESIPLPEKPDQDIELRGPEIKQQPDVFAIPLFMPSDNTEEQSIEDIRKAVERTSVDETGNRTAKDKKDKPAVRIADIINQQRADPLADFAFNR
jgi:hypothetical protein